ncbi:MAG: hypothetical protein L6Q57_03695 [Alphaproteobacteria bacterium]|nr:hypothetical protein [Alphaproteobacteria bacterium]
MKTLWTSLEADIITGGRSTQPWRATGIALNMRQLRPGDLFFAASLREAAQALAHGAAAAVIASRGGDILPSGPMMLVPDLYEALRDLARAARFRTHAQILAVAGFTLREQLKSVLKAHGHVHAAGPHFSHSLALLPEMADYALFGCVPGLRPDLCVITDARSTQIAALEGMNVQGRVIVCADDPHHLEAVTRARALGIAGIITVPEGMGRGQDLASFIAHLAGAPLGEWGNVHLYRPRALSFGVNQVIEIGGHKTAMLIGRKGGIALQTAYAPFGYMCSGGGIATDARPPREWEEICPQVLGPGDRVVFDIQQPEATFAGAFRRL